VKITGPGLYRLNRPQNPIDWPSKRRISEKYLKSQNPLQKKNGVRIYGAITPSRSKLKKSVMPQ